MKQHSAQAATANTSFDIISGDGVHTVTYRKAKYTPSMVFFAMIAFAIMAAIPAGLLGNGWVWFFFTFVVPIGLYFFLNAQRKPETFHITRNTFSVGGVAYDRKDITELFIKVPYNGEHVTRLASHHTLLFMQGGDRVSNIGLGTTSAVTTGVSVAVDGARKLSTAAAEKVKQQYIRRNHAIGFHYGNRKIYLAKGLAENTSGPLIRKIIELAEQ